MTASCNFSNVFIFRNRMFPRKLPRHSQPYATVSSLWFRHVWTAGQYTVFGCFIYELQASVQSLIRSFPDYWKFYTVFGSILSGLLASM